MFTIFSIALCMLVILPGVMMAGDSDPAVSLNGNEEVVLSFITINGYSNNLFIDNVTLGTQSNTDVSVASINKIERDTSYAIGSSSFKIAPSVTIVNVGLTDVTIPFDVTLSVMPTSYSSVRSIATLNSGQSQEVEFDSLTITPGTEMNITAYTALGGDENPGNDTLRQYSLVFPGVQRSNVLLEEWTNASCGPCASNNPTIDAFVNAHFGSLVPIKYHVWWPGSNDPMYQYNTAENRARTDYYGIGGVPHVIMGGVTHPVYPYTTSGSLFDAYSEQMSKGTPIEVSVTDTRIPGDSIQADVTVAIHAPLQAGDYYLRVQAVERKIEYATPPGTNGERVFFDVFRKAYPNVSGTPLPTAVGNYNFRFTYAIDTPVWADTMVYTAVFVQDDVTKKVWGCDKGRDVVFSSARPFVTANLSSSHDRRRCVAGEMKLNRSIVVPDRVARATGVFNFELFESSFPPAGWKLVNPDGSITFEEYDGANGPTFGGSKSVLVDFYSYSATGQVDTLYSRSFTGLEATDSVRFDYAHAEYPGFGPDRLIVEVSIDGGQTFPHRIFDKAGSDLATVPQMTGSFVPTSGSQWARFVHSLDGILTSVEPSMKVPTQFELEQNYPNPFNPSTLISYSIAQEAKVSLKVYDVIGREVESLVEGVQPAGTYTVSFDASMLSSGVYFYQIKAAGFLAMKKMVLLQ
jgi:hypothetical protein